MNNPAATVAPPRFHNKSGSAVARSHVHSPGTPKGIAVSHRISMAIAEPRSRSISKKVADFRFRSSERVHGRVETLPLGTHSDRAVRTPQGAACAPRRRPLDFHGSMSGTISKRSDRSFGCGSPRIKKLPPPEDCGFPKSSDSASSVCLIRSFASSR